MLPLGFQPRGQPGWLPGSPGNPGGHGPLPFGSRSDWHGQRGSCEAALGAQAGTGVAADMPSPLSSTTRVCSLRQSTGSPMTSTSTKGSMICAEGRVAAGPGGHTASSAPTPSPGGLPTSPRSPSIESRGFGSCCPLMTRSTSCFLSCPGRGSSELGLKRPGGGVRLSRAGQDPLLHRTPPPPLAGREPQPRRRKGRQHSVWGHQACTLVTFVSPCGEDTARPLAWVTQWGLARV